MKKREYLKQKNEALKASQKNVNEDVIGVDTIKANIQNLDIAALKDIVTKISEIMFIDGETVNIDKDLGADAISEITTILSDAGILDTVPETDIGEATESDEFKAQKIACKNDLPKPKFEKKQPVKENVEVKTANRYL